MKVKHMPGTDYSCYQSGEQANRDEVRGKFTELENTSNILQGISKFTEQ